MAGLLAGFCVSATAASSATSDVATQAEQEIAMSKCTKDTTEEDGCNGKSDCSNSTQCKEQASVTSEMPAPRKSAAQKVVEGN